MRNSRNSRPHRSRAWYPAAAALVGLPLLGAMAAVPASAAPGSGWIQQVKWTSQQVAPGVTVRTGVLANPAAAPHWTVIIDATTTSSITGTTANEEVGTPA